MTQTMTVTKFGLLEDVPAQTTIYLIAKVTDIVDMSTYTDDVTYSTSVQISDGSKTMQFRVWKPIEEVETHLQINKVYKLYMLVQMYKGKPSLKYISEQPMTDEAVLRRFDLSTFRGLSPENYQFFVESVRKIKDFRLRRLVEVCYGLGKCPAHINPTVYKKRLDKQVSGFGSIRRHDDYAGGIINHVAGMLRVVVHLEETYGNLERGPIARCERQCEVKWDLVRVLVFLHDLGKQDTYIRTPSSRVVYREGTRLEHQHASMVLVSKYLRDLEPEYLLSYKEEQEILGGIAGHHEQGYDKTTEEKLLSAVDNIDAACVDCLLV